MTTPFNYYELACPSEGVGNGFTYRTVPHLTLKSIANNEPPDEEVLYDEPTIDRTKARVTGPFTLEAVPAPAVRPITEVMVEPQPVSLDGQPTLPGVGELELQPKLRFTEDVSVARFGETLRQRQWRDELLACGIRGKGGQRIQFVRLEPLGATRWLQCEGETRPFAAEEHAAKRPSPPAPLPQAGEGSLRVVVSFGPEHAPLEQRQVELALEEAVQLKPTPKVVLFAAFQFDPEAAKDIDETRWPGVTLLKAQMNTDLLTDDLKKKRSSNESYWLMGQPDVELRRAKKADGTRRVPATLYEVEVHGFDYYNPRTGAIESGDTTKIALWMLDTDYDGRSLFPRQVFFPMAGPKDGWARLAKNLKAEIDEDLIEAYRGTVSLPFEPGDYRRVAVKIVDDRGIESLKIIEIG
jgi:adenine-specific DNA-methyltransferase